MKIRVVVSKLLFISILSLCIYSLGFVSIYGIEINYNFNILPEVVEIEYQESEDPLLIYAPPEPIEITKQLNEIGLVRAEKTSLHSNIFKNTKAQSQNFNAGVYEVSGDEIEKKTYEIPQNGLVRFYFDNNENGKKDSDEEYIKDDELEKIELHFEKIADEISYNLTAGWNSIAIPMIMEGTATSRIDDAAGLINVLNRKGANVTHVTVYREGKFLVYSERITNSGTAVFGKNFQLTPGEGIFIKNYWASDIKLRGRKIDGQLDIIIRPGWNLVNIYNSNKNNYTGYGVLDSLINQNFNADLISGWNGGYYENIIRVGENRFGEDFTLLPNSGYWVRSKTEESRVFKPED